MVGALEISIDLCAEEPIRERVLRVTRDARRSPALHGGDRRTRIGTIVRTGSTHDAGVALNERRSAHRPARWRGRADRPRKGTLRASAGPRPDSVTLIRSMTSTYHWVLAARECKGEVATPSRSSRWFRSTRGRSLRQRIVRETHCCPCTWTIWPALTRATGAVDFRPILVPRARSMATADHPAQGDFR